MASADHSSLPHSGKVCNTCGELKSLDGYELRPTRGNPEYRRPMCNTCKNQRKRASIKSDPERLAQQRAWDRKYWAANADSIAERRRANPKRKATEKKRQDRLRSDMTPAYISVRLRLPMAMIPPDLAEAKRTSLLIKRFIWGRTK